MNLAKKFRKFIFMAAGILLVSAVLVTQIPAAKALTISPPRIEISGDPGETLSASFKLINEEKVSKILYLIPQNFEAKDETGDPDYVPGRDNLAGWIQAADFVTVGPGEEQVVDFKIKIPSNAEPGGYFTALFLQSSPPDFEQGGGIGIGSQLGTLVLLKVNGSITDEAGVLEFATKDKKRWFNSLPIEFYYRFQNTGDTWVKPLGEVIITNTLGIRSKLLPANKTKGNVLSRSIRKFETAWIHSGGELLEDSETKVVYPELHGFWENVKYQWEHFAFGFYRAKLNLAYGSPAQLANASFMFFVFPWQLSLVALGVGIILAIILRFIIRRYNRAIIARAQRGMSEPEPAPRPKRVSKKKA